MGGYTESCAITRHAIVPGDHVFACALQNFYGDDITTYGLLQLLAEERQRVEDTQNENLSAEYRLSRLEYSRMQNVITMCEVGTYDGYGWILERKRPDKPVRGVDQYIFFVRLSVASQICGHDVSAPASSNIETLKEIVEFAFETRTELFASIPIGFQQVNWYRGA